VEFTARDVCQWRELNQYENFVLSCSLNSRGISYLDLKKQMQKEDFEEKKQLEGVDFIKFESK